MSGFFNEKSRQVIPRWLDYRNSCALRLLTAAKPKTPPNITFLPNPDNLKDWETAPTLITAADLVAESFILGRHDGTQPNDAARFILKHAPPESLLIRELATTFLYQDVPIVNFVENSDSDKHSQRCVAILKRSVRSTPINPIAWSDLSLLYAMLGHREKARRAMKCALSLGPENRFILRNAARCFLHLDEDDRAIHLLRSSGLCKRDPWITAAEIAVADGLERHSTCIKNARLLLDDNNNSPLAKSELAAALSTIEAKSGSRKKVNTLVRQALADPSENALAQIEWLATQRYAQEPPATPLTASFEAQARHFQRAKLFPQSLDAAEKWYAFQPFSSGPLLLSTFIASVCLNDDDRAIRIARKAAPAKRRDPLLLNNLAFAYARKDYLLEAANALRMIDMSVLEERQVLTVAATNGLVLFRSGYVQEGREMYRKAVTGFDRLAQSRSAAMAAFFWACEEKRLATPEASALVVDAKKRVKQAVVFELDDAASIL